ncbi:MAG TPA: acetylglutamate kinase [Firmicutes bacterium]|nr:acetylglutamate kinase [Bacillota bacterium]
MQSSVEKAGILVEALPYIRTFAGKTFVIKYGGHAMEDPELKRAVVLDVILLKYVGVHPVIVHGGGPEITAMLERLGKKSEFVAGMRVTDAETMEIVQMVLVGKVNQELVALINRYGGRAVGLSGIDGNLIVARKHQMTPEEAAAAGGSKDLGYVGEVEAINPAVVHLLSQAGYIPVVSSVGAGLAGETYNINADLVAGELAAALGAEKLIMLTDVEGIFEDPNDPDSLISALQMERASRMIEEHRIQGGMIPKVQACVRALARGVSRAHIIDGRKLHSLLLEIFTDRGIGTMVIG